MAVETVVTEGFGSFGDVAHVITDGFDIGAASVTPADATILTQAFGALTATSAFVVTEGFRSGTPTPTPTPTPTGQESTAGGGIPSRRRRYIFPDGTQVMATLQEVQELLFRFVRARAEEAERNAKTGRRRGKSLRVPRIEIEQVEWQQVSDAAGELLAPNLPNRMVWKPDRREFAEEVSRLKRRIDDEEAIIALLT